MIDEQGQVTNIIDGKLGIKVTAEGSCDSCPIHDNCYGSGQLVWVPAQEGIHLNDHVRFSVANTSVLKISALVYGLPLAGVFAGILLGYLWLFRSFRDDPKTLLSFGLGVLLFAAGAFAVSRIDRLMRKRLQYTVIRVEPSGGTSPEASPLPARAPGDPSDEPALPQSSSAGSR